MEVRISFQFVRNMGYDIPASFVVFLVALPLCLGIALASGAPLFSGIVAGVVGGIVAGTLSKSSLSVSGPAAGLTTVVLSSIQELGSYPLFLLCVVLAGVIQIALGKIKAGNLGHFVPVSVIRGMLSAIGLILILKQVPHALGYDADYEGDETFFQPDHHNTFSELFTAWGQLSLGAAIISLISLAIMAFWARETIQKHSWSKFIPGALIAVVMGILLQSFFGWFPELALRESHMVRLPDFGTLSNIFVFPDWTGLMDPRTYRIALTIALIASLESILSVEAIDKLDTYRRKTPLNPELRAQGISNIVSGFLGGLPITAVIVRGSANIQAGAKTKLSAVLHGVLLLVLVLSMPGLIQQIPLACLAGILLLVGFKLNEPSQYREIYHKGIDQFLPFIVTVVAILFSDLLTGIGIGLLVSVFFVLKTNHHTAVILVNQGSQYLLKFAKDVSFLNKSSLRKALERIPGNATLIIDGSRCSFVDADIIETIEDYLKSAPTKGIEVEIRKTLGAQPQIFRKEEKPPLNGNKKYYHERA